MCMILYRNVDEFWENDHEEQWESDIFTFPKKLESANGAFYSDHCPEV